MYFSYASIYIYIYCYEHIYILILVLCICQDCYSKAAELLGVQEELVRVKHLEKLTQLKAEVDEDTKENGNCMEVVRQDKKPMVEKITRDKPLNNEDNYDGIWKVDSRIASVLAAILGVLFVFALYKFNKLV